MDGQMKGASVSTLSLDQSLEIANQLVELPLRSGIFLFTGEGNRLYELAQHIVDRFALHGEIYVIAGGNRFSTRNLPLLLQNQTDIYAVMGRIRISRAETCYQMLHALQTTRLTVSPLIVTDILDSFYEEKLTSMEVENTLSECLSHLQRLSLSVPVVVSARTHPKRTQLLEMLWEVSEQVLVLDSLPASVMQPELL